MSNVGDVPLVPLAANCANYANGPHAINAVGNDRNSVRPRWRHCVSWSLGCLTSTWNIVHGTSQHLTLFAARSSFPKMSNVGMSHVRSQMHLSNNPITQIRNSQTGPHRSEADSRRWFARSLRHLR